MEQPGAQPYLPAGKGEKQNGADYSSQGTTPCYQPALACFHRLSLFLGCAFIFLGIQLIPPDSQAAEPITIAGIFSQTGIAAVHNKPLVTMVQLAVEEINDSGGINHRPLELILLDNQSTPIGATIAAEEAMVAPIGVL